MPPGPDFSCLPGREQGEGRLAGKRSMSRPLLKDPGYYRYVKLSPDRRRLLYSSAGDLTTYDLDRGTTAQLTRGIRVRNPIWTPDGRFVVFSTLRGLSWVRSDGPSEPRLLFEEQNPPLRLAFSFRREDNRLAYNEIATKSGVKCGVKCGPCPSASTGRD